MADINGRDNDDILVGGADDDSLYAYVGTDTVTAVAVAVAAAAAVAVAVAGTIRLSSGVGKTTSLAPSPTLRQVTAPQTKSTLTALGQGGIG